LALEKKLGLDFIALLTPSSVKRGPPNSVYDFYPPAFLSLTQSHPLQSPRSFEFLDMQTPSRLIFGVGAVFAAASVVTVVYKVVFASKKTSRMRKYFGQS